MERDSNQTYKSYVHLGNPLLYTGNQCKGVYNLANAQVAHINIYCKKVFRVDYEIFNGLKGNIKEIEEEHIFEPDSSSGASLNHKKRYMFNELKELSRIHEIDGTIKLNILEFEPSLKACSKQIITYYIKSEVHNISTFFYDKNMQYHTSESIMPSRKEPKHITTYHTNNEKYIYKDGIVIQKNRYLNDHYEQTRAIITFDENANILEVKANKQNDKYHMYYGSKYQYNDQKNIEIIQFYRNKLGSKEVDLKQDYLFDYDTNGNLKSYRLKGNSNSIAKYTYDKMGNPILRIKNNSRYVYSYRYDDHGNWIKRIEMVNAIEAPQKVRKKTTTRRIEYYT